MTNTTTVQIYIGIFHIIPTYIHFNHIPNNSIVHFDTHSKSLILAQSVHIHGVITHHGLPGSIQEGVMEYHLLDIGMLHHLCFSPR